MGTRATIGRGGLRAAAGAAAVLALSAVPAAAATFSNLAPIAIPDSGAASPYPSTIDVAGLSGTLTEVEVTVSGFSHANPTDVGLLLVGPGGQAVELMDGAGIGAAATDLTFTFDDDASAALRLFGRLASGTWKPSGHFIAACPAPAPAIPFCCDALLSVFDGTDPAATWQLFIWDRAAVISGAISGGWSLELTVAPPAAAPLPAGAAPLLSALARVALRRRA
jgi:hypothetical protein